MHSLKRLNNKSNKSAWTAPSMRSNETIAFKKDVQLLERAIRKKLDEKPISSGNLLATLLDEEEPLIDRLTPHWQRRTVLRLIRSLQLLIRRQEDPQQYVLPGFEDLPQRVEFEGHRLRLATARYPKATAYLVSLKAQGKCNNQRIAKMEALVALMEKYIQKEPEITVREVCEREQG